jgi:hypothetical protein
MNEKSLSKSLREQIYAGIIVGFALQKAQVSAQSEAL